MFNVSGISVKTNEKCYLQLSPTRDGWSQRMIVNDSSNDVGERIMWADDTDVAQTTRYLSRAHLNVDYCSNETEHDIMQWLRCDLKHVHVIR